MGADTMLSPTIPGSVSNSLHRIKVTHSELWWHILSFGMNRWIDEETHDCLKRMEIILECDLGESGFPSSNRCAQAAHIFYYQSMHDKEKREVIFSWKSWGGWVWLEPDPMSLICIRCPPLPTKEDARIPAYGWKITVVILSCPEARLQEYR